MYMLYVSRCAYCVNAVWHLMGTYMEGVVLQQPFEIWLHYPGLLYIWVGLGADIASCYIALLSATVKCDPHCEHACLPENMPFQRSSSCVAISLVCMLRFSGSLLVRNTTKHVKESPAGNTRQGSLGYFMRSECLFCPEADPQKCE